MQPILYTFPKGATHALTFSYDDGVTQDRRLVEILNRHGLKATFHLNAGALDTPRCVTSAEAPQLYRGHEIASHTLNHPFPSMQPNEVNLAQLLDDRRALEKLAGCPVRGFSYPFGDTGNGYPQMLSVAGIDYARTVNAHHRFHLPDDFLLWHPTCHHNDRLSETWDQFVPSHRFNQMKLMYVWGHSYEFDGDGNWGMMEDFCAKAGAMKDCWFAANGEIYNYVAALRRVRWSVDGGCADNPSALSVFARTVGGALLEIKPGLNRLPEAEGSRP